MSLTTIKEELEVLGHTDLVKVLADNKVSAKWKQQRNSVTGSESNKKSVNLIRLKDDSFYYIDKKYNQERYITEDKKFYFTIDDLDYVKAYKAGSDGKAKLIEELCEPGSFYDLKEAVKKAYKNFDTDYKIKLNDSHLSNKEPINVSLAAVNKKTIPFTASDHNKLTFAFESVKNGNEREIKNEEGKIVAIFYPNRKILKITDDNDIIEWLKDNSFINESTAQVNKKIDIYVDGKYTCSTIQSKNLKEAKEKFLKDPSWQGRVSPNKFGKNRIDDIKNREVQVEYAKSQSRSSITSQAKSEKITVKFYTDTDRYTGFEKVDYKNNFLELKSWIDSDNYLKVKDVKIDTVNKLRKLFLEQERMNKSKSTASYKVLAQSTDREVGDYEIIDHGVEDEQYFKGCGTAGTKFGDVYTGIGDSAYDALEDALEQAATSDWNISSVENNLSKEVDVPQTEDDSEDDTGIWHYVSIRLKQNEAKAKVTANVEYTVRLKDGTVGTIDSDTLDGQSAEDFIGEIMNVHLHDENGNPIEEEGIIVEVLDEKKY